MSGGRKAQAAGAALERFLIESCAWLGARSRCVVERQKPPYKHLGQLTAWLESHGVRIEGVSEGLWVGLYSGGSSVDFEGDVRGMGAVAFDAKSSQDKTAFRFGLVEDEQLLHLRRRVAVGKHCFLYARKTCAPVADFILPVDQLGRIAGVTHKRSHDALLGSGRESVQWAELESMGLKVSAGEYWLDALERIIKAGRWPA